MLLCVQYLIHRCSKNKKVAGQCTCIKWLNVRYYRYKKLIKACCESRARDNSAFLVSITEFVRAASLPCKLIHHTPPFPRVSALEVINFVFIELAFPAGDNLSDLISKATPFLLRAI